MRATNSRRQGMDFGMYSFDGLKKKAFFLTFALTLTLALACQKKSDGPNFDDEGPSNLDNTFDSSGVDDALNGPNLQKGGSSLTDADKTALNNLVGQFDDVAPDNGADVISQALAQEMKRLLEEEKAGKNVAMQKMALAGQMMKECSARIAELAPRPGQPLLGRYRGTVCGAAPVVKKATGPIPPPPGAPAGQVFLEIIDPYDRGPGRGVPNGAPPLFKVQGLTNGKMQANAGGQGQIDGEPWAGTVSDQGLNGRAAAGTIVNQKFNSTKYGFQSCSMGIGLENSRNPIPENYIEAMRRAGACFRQTLFLMSPIMDNMFKSMDPQLAQILKLRMLGIQ